MLNVFVYLFRFEHRPEHVFHQDNKYDAGMCDYKDAYVYANMYRAISSKGKKKG